MTLTEYRITATIYIDYPTLLTRAEMIDLLYGALDASNVLIEAEPTGIEVVEAD